MYCVHNKEVVRVRIISDRGPTTEVMDVSSGKVFYTLPRFLFKNEIDARCFLKELIWASLAPV